MEILFEQAIYYAGRSFEEIEHAKKATLAECPAEGARQLLSVFWDCVQEMKRKEAK